MQNLLNDILLIQEKLCSEIITNNQSNKLVRLDNNSKIPNELLNEKQYISTSSLILSSYVYYTINTPLTGLILYSIPSGLHDTMVKFATGPSAEFAISVDEKMQLNKEFDFEGDKSYVLAVDNGIVFWNELTEELNPPEPPGEWLFEMTGMTNPEYAAINGRYKKANTYDSAVATSYGILYVNENEQAYIILEGQDAGVNIIGIGGIVSFFDADLAPAEPWNWTNYSSLTITPIV